MITSLKTYITPNTPFLARVLVTEKPAGLGSVDKFGFGPRFHSPAYEIMAIECENTLISTYIDSWIRGQIYLHCWKLRSTPILTCGCKLIEQSAQQYPLRFDSQNNIIDPVILKGMTVVEANPLWMNAAKEAVFGFEQDAVSLDGHVFRELYGDRSAFKIDLSLHIPEGAVCMQILNR